VINIGNADFNKSSARKLKVLGFWASENREMCKLFRDGHEKVLFDHGIRLTTAEYQWESQDNVYVFLTFENDIAVGGIRLERINRDNQKLSSVGGALKSKDEKVIEKILNLGYLNIGEACGLWNDKVVTNEGLSLILSRCCLAAAPLLNCDVMIAFSGKYTRRISEDMGGVIIKTLGDEGLFDYPNKKFKSMIWNFDVLNINKASTECQSRIRSLRNELSQIYLEHNSRNGLEIEYHIKL
jgi:hypothetical protein